MIIDGTVALCLGNFMRQELKYALERYDFEGFGSTLVASLSGKMGYSLCAVEVAILRTLNIFCDPVTSTHAQRLVYLAEAIATRLHLSQEEVMMLRLAALLHDIGKVGVPAAILHKPGPLTMDEWQWMRRHPEIGLQILQMAGGIFELLAPGVIFHHECWDGSGYPAGLQGEEIPLPARILAVVDSYDAMTSHRTYGRLLTVQEACSELQRCAGRQYDSCVVTAFLAVLDERNAQTVPHLSPFSFVNNCFTKFTPVYRSIA